MKILKELKMNFYSKADYFKRELTTIRRNQEKLENSFAKMKAELKVVHSRMNNAEKCISDLEDRIMEITQLEQQMESQVKKIKAI